jgi:hypothetical protein
MSVQKLMTLSQYETDLEYLTERRQILTDQLLEVQMNIITMMEKIMELRDEK